MYAYESPKTRFSRENCRVDNSLRHDHPGARRHQRNVGGSAASKRILEHDGRRGKPPASKYGVRSGIVEFRNVVPFGRSKVDTKTILTPAIEEE